jgi:hypothetical protein
MAFYGAKIRNAAGTQAIFRSEADCAKHKRCVASVAIFPPYISGADRQKNIAAFAGTEYDLDTR